MSQETVQEPSVQDATPRSDDPQTPPGFIEAFKPYFLPGQSNDLEMLRRLGGCPGCGEGRDLDIESKGATSYIGDPASSDIACRSCGLRLEGDGRKFKIADGPEQLRGLTLSIDDCKRLASARRDGDASEVEAALAEVRPDTTNTTFEESSTTVTASGIIAWFTGVVTVLVGFNSLQLGNAAASLFFLPAGLFVLPPVRRAIDRRTGISFSRAAVVILFLMLYSIGAVLYSFAMPA